MKYKFQCPICSMKGKKTTVVIKFEGEEGKMEHTCKVCNTTMYLEYYRVNEPICDSCNKTSHEPGGFLFSSSAICPKCAPEWLKKINRFNESHLIKKYCPADKPWDEWVREDIWGQEKIFNLVITTPNEVK